MNKATRKKISDIYNDYKASQFKNPIRRNELGGVYDARIYGGEYLAWVNLVPPLQLQARVQAEGRH